jgi:threonyl-tRNA synthetase
VAERITITLPDGSRRDYDHGTTPADVAASIGSRLAKATLAAKVDGEYLDSNQPLTKDATVELITADSPDGREVLRHSTAHVLAQAVTDLYPGAK